MNGNSLARLYGINTFAIKSNLEGFTEQDAMYQPAPGGNCANWILGHIVATRSQILEYLGEPPLWTEEEIKPFLRGSDPTANTQITIPLSRMLSDLEASQEKLAAVLNRMTPEQFQAPINDQTMYDKLAFLQFHEGYHAGQLGMLRRLVGKSGAIQ